MMKNKDIKNLNLEELRDNLITAKAELTKLKLVHKINPIQNPIQIRNLRKDIARINTEITNQQ